MPPAVALFISTGILAYYQALEPGPVSVVVPIHGLFIVGSSPVGLVAFDETVTVRKIGAIALRVLAIALMSV